MKRFIPFLVFGLILLLLPLSVCQGENLLVNADFQQLDDDGLPSFWYPDAYILEPGYTVFSLSESPEGPAVEIRNIGSNDARFAQEVEVEPDSVYCLSGDIWAEDVEGGHGANLSVEGIYAFSEPLYDTEGQWQHIEYYGETGPDQDRITVFARLGGYSGESTGTARFRNLSLERVEDFTAAAYEDAIADLWYRESAPAYAPEGEDEEDAAAPAWPWLLVIAVMYAAVTAFVIHALGLRDPLEEGREPGRERLAAALILCLSLALRVVLSAMIAGYMVDVNCFLSWGHTFASVGPVRFYESTSFCDYPPLYTYVLGLNSAVSGLLGGGEAVSRIVFRLVPSLFDLAACWVLYRMLLSRENCRRSHALLILAMLAFHPAMILNSAAWGQMDGVLCALLMGVAVLAIERKWMLALPLYVISVLVKPQALMLGPLGLTYILKAVFREKESRRPMLIGTALGVAALILGVLPFSLHQSWDWLFNLYGSTLGSYPYTTLNTANFYYLLSGNWVKLELTAGVAALLVLAALCAAYAFLWRKRASHFRLWQIESGISLAFAAAFVLLAVFGGSWGLAGSLAMAFTFVIILSQAIRGDRIELLSYLGALLYILLYVFGVKMHERYLFPAFLLLASAWVYFRDRRILIVLALFSFTVFVNEGIVLDNSIRLGSAKGHLNEDTILLANILSVLNILGAIYAVYLSLELLLGRTSEAAREGKPVFPVKRIARDALKSTPPLDRSLHWTKRDTLILTAITLAFSTVSLLTLGSTKAPQTEWIASSDEEAVIFDLGEKRENFSILYFAQVSREDFTFAVSDDGETWSEEYWAQMDQGQCWKWKYLTNSAPGAQPGTRNYYNSDLQYVLRLSGRYVRLSAQHLGLTLNEVLFRDEAGNALSATVSGRTGAVEESELYSDPARLLDEPDTLEKLPEPFGNDAARLAPAQPGWWNSTYFDEIYHARTAFEFLKGTVPYETSHPPLGKVLMSACVALFGMTPFGWRFAGALAGILMLPGMYLLGKQLTKKTSVATLTCLFMALDCMHLTQTQIATIDSFPVLFIIFSYFFMLRFLQADPYGSGLKAVLPSLAASGFFMGLSIASKWIGIYAGGGLAILFFWHCFRMMGDRKDAMRRLLVICAWCVLFFIAVPVIQYLLSYIPYMAYNSRRIHSLGDYISEVWRSQLNMFNYHSTKNLGMDHPFYSPWWQWPVIGKPMYYAAEQYLPADSSTHHSIFCIGNPVVWYGGLAALLLCALRALNGRRYLLEDRPGVWHLQSVSRDARYMFIFTGILAQYLPWVLVPRGTYIYHYFASLPFLMLALSLCFDGWGEKGQRTVRWLRILLVVLTAAAFVLFFPYASGISAPEGWMNLGRGLLRIWY